MSTVNDLIIDRSPLQKGTRIEKIRDELAVMGYSIVETGWLNATLLANLSRERGRPKKIRAEYLEAAE